MNIPDTLRAVTTEAYTDLPLIALNVRRVTSSKRRAPHFSLMLPHGQCTLRLRRVEDHMELDVRGVTEEAQRVLRGALVTQGGLTQRKGEHHRLAIFPQGITPSAITAAVAGWAQYILAYARDDHALQELSRFSSGAELALWWEGQSNFGDLLNPWLVSTITGKTVLNARHARTEQPVIAGVGSIIHMITHGTTNIWGSGLMYPPSPKQARRLLHLPNVAVHAVRGRKTRDALQEHLGWDVPEVFGDPGLLLPRYLPVEPPQSGAHRPIALVPHYKHQNSFPRAASKEVSLVDVREDLRTVVSAIATSRVCLSTSLHGIIIAQAYGIPWVWLTMQGHALQGGDFKFEDFFSTLDAEAVSTAELPAGDSTEVDFEAIAEAAALPELTIDLDALDAAFPHERAAQPSAASQPAFSWSEIPAEDTAAAITRASMRRVRRTRKKVRNIPKTVKQRLPF